MVKQQMENKMQELFQAIQESKEYQSYLNIGRVIEQDDEIVSLVNEIKKLQKRNNITNQFFLNFI